MSTSPPNKPDLQKKLHDVPHKPGIYLMRDRLNRVIYVGKARDLRKRLANYFTPSRKRLAEHKTRALIQSIWDFDYHTVRNEPEALLLEGKLIKDYRPKYNVAFRDDKRFLLVKVHLDEPWPRFTTTRLRKEDGSRYFGPFAHSGALRRTIDWMNREFGLRSCRPLEPGENDYRHCHDDVIKNCTAPCMGRINRDDYLLRVEQACEFLKGHSKDMVGTLEEEMHAAAEKLNFEKAAELRDMIENLKKRGTDIAKAKALLAEAGHPNGIQLKIDLNADAAWEVAAAQAMREMWLKAGIDVQLNVLPGAQFWGIWDKTPFGMTGWTHRPLGVMVMNLCFALKSTSSCVVWMKWLWPLAVHLPRLNQRCISHCMMPKREKAAVGMMTRSSGY